MLVFVVNTTMGFAGWLGTVFNPANSGVPLIVMAVAVAHSVHIVLTTLQRMSHGLDRNAAIAQSLRSNAYPVFLTTLTTAIGFLSLNGIGFATFSRLGQLRGLWRVMCLRLLHDSPASDAFAPAIACASCPP